MSQWNALAATIAEAQSWVAETAPDEATKAAGNAYVARVATAALNGAFLGHLSQENGLGRALPVQGGPNPDYRMFHAPISAEHPYRLTGNLHGSERIGIGLYKPGALGGLTETGYYVITPAQCAPDGTFTLSLSADPADTPHLVLTEDTRILLIRVLHRNPDSLSARLALEGGSIAQGLSLITGSHDGALQFVDRSIRKTVQDYLVWTQAAQNLENRLDSAPPELAAAVQGDPDTQYYLGGFALQDGEYLEITLPEGLSSDGHNPSYWSIHAYNFWYEPLQTAGVHDANAQADPDGHIRIAVGPQVPQTARNVIRTHGVSRGAFVGRIIGGTGCPQATVRTL